MGKCLVVGLRRDSGGIGVIGNGGMAGYLWIDSFSNYFIWLNLLWNASRPYMISPNSRVRGMLCPRCSSSTRYWPSRTRFLPMRWRRRRSISLTLKLLPIRSQNRLGFVSLKYKHKHHRYLIPKRPSWRSCNRKWKNCIDYLHFNPPKTPQAPKATTLQ